MELRPLCVVTGTLEIAGGDKTVTLKKTGTTFTRSRDISDERKKANVVKAHYARALRELRLCSTPFGALFDAARFTQLRAIIDEITVEVGKFNSGATECSIANGYVLETLAGSRLAAVRGWAMGRPDLQVLSAESAVF